MGFVAVCPNGTGRGTFLVWNAGGFWNAAGRPNDVAFIAALLDDLTTVAWPEARRRPAAGRHAPAAARSPRRNVSHPPTPTCPSLARWSDGRDGAEVVLVTIDGGGHTWPGQRPPVWFIGRSTADVSANDLIWVFFLRHPLP